MTGYQIANLDYFLETIGEDKLNAILADYSCPLNEDVEHFLKHSAAPFSRQGLAKTHLIFASYKDAWVLVGYFALAMKTFHIKHAKSLSSKLRSRMRRFARIIDETGAYEIAAPLIAQLGKNFANGYDKLITGDELLKLACDKVAGIHSAMGGKIAYLECEDKQPLLDFYERNGFVAFDKRPLDKADRDMFKSDHLVQMLKYF
jgi:hypothetical protein